MNFRLPAAALVLAMGLACAAGIADAAPRISVETLYYDVRGGDAGALVSYMLRHGPSSASGRALGTTTAVVRHDGDFSGEERCRLSNYYVEVDLTIRLPRLASGQQLSGSLRRQWNGFAAHVRQHENRHKSIYQGCARRIERRVRALNGTMSCQALQAQMRRVFNEENDRCDSEHAAFDAEEAARIGNLPLIVRASQPAPRRAASRSGNGGAVPSNGRLGRRRVEDLK